MMKKDKLYSINQWNRPLLNKGNLFGIGGLARADKAANPWDYAEDFERLKDDIDEDVDETIEDADSETVDYWLSEFYDLCNAARVWLEV